MLKHEMRNIIERVQVNSRRHKFLFNRFKLFEVLKRNGYGYIKIDNRDVFMLREMGGLKMITITRIQDDIWDEIERLDVENLPEGLSIEDVLNMFLDQRPIKKNEAIKRVLRVDLNDDEIETLKNRIKSRI